jgi:Domain of unknown function (DUF6285)
MLDRPSAVELILAVKEHLEREVLPALEDPKLRYRTLVAAHVLSVVERELALGERAVRDELASLRALQGEGGAEPAGATLRELEDELLRRTLVLCAAIRRGDVGDRVRVATHVRRAVLAKLAIANPGYASLRRITPSG